MKLYKGKDKYHSTYTALISIPIELWDCHCYIFSYTKILTPLFLLVSTHRAALLLEKKTATHSSVLAWGNPWTEKPGRQHGVVKSQTLLNERHIKFYINCDHLHNVYAIFFYIVASSSLLLQFPPSILHHHHGPNQSPR